MFNQDKNGIFSITRGDSGFISCIYNKEGVENPTPVYDTSDATATSGDIVKGKTAYIDGGKVVGIYEPNLMEKTITENGVYKRYARTSGNRGSSESQPSSSPRLL